MSKYRLAILELIKSSFIPTLSQVITKPPLLKKKHHLTTLKTSTIRQILVSDDTLGLQPVDG